MDPLKREGLHEQITRRLGMAILSGELHDGELSSELTLCKSLGVSRTVLRESIKVLASKGLLELRPKVGVRFLPKQDWNLFDPDVLAWQSEGVVDEDFICTLCEVRLIVETAASGLAATRGTPKEKLFVAECYRQKELTRDNKPAHVEADVAFHGAIFDASHNDLLRQLGKTIRAALRLQDSKGNESDVEKSMELHREVTLAICHGDAAAASTAMGNVIFHAARGFCRVNSSNTSIERAEGSDATHCSAFELRSADRLQKFLVEYGQSHDLVATAPHQPTKPDDQG